MAPADEPDGPPNPDAVDDSDLLGRIAEGDVEAFAVLYRRYVRPVFGLALSRLHDRKHAERATLDAFVAIWRAAATVVPERGSRARWVFTVAGQSILGQSRVARRTQPDAEDWLVFRVHAAVAELPEPDRVALELAYWSGHSRPEIADLLGIPLDLVDTRTRRALARLVVQLEGLR